MPLKRRAIRERVLQVLYAYELSQESIDAIVTYIMHDLMKYNEEYTFAVSLVRKVVEKRKELDAIIKRKVENWEFDRIAVIDRIVLRMGICELLYFEDIPPKVSINEAIEIARRFSTEKSDKFVNGILDSVFLDLKKEGKLKKSGRGLLDTSIRTKTKE
ncbi:MAG: transcription antitermination factor NusB [Bacteroidetes bacterium]|nr:transcription antitermination factor NusB [Bacteroidota bacterium]